MELGKSTVAITPPVPENAAPPSRSMIITRDEKATYLGSARNHLVLAPRHHDLQHNAAATGIGRRSKVHRLAVYGHLHKACPWNAFDRHSNGRQ